MRKTSAEIIDLKARLIEIKPARSHSLITPLAYQAAHLPTTLSLTQIKILGVHVLCEEADKGRQNR